MAGRGTTTFQKRQKEQLRKEKRDEKLARRQQRKLEGPAVDPMAPVDPDASPDLAATEGESATPAPASAGNDIPRVDNARVDNA